MGTHVNLIHSICANYSVISIIFVGMFLAQPNSGMNEVIKTPFSFLPESSFVFLPEFSLHFALDQTFVPSSWRVSFVHWYEHVSIVFGDIPCSASPGIFWNLSRRWPLSYRNQSISKSMDWFLHDNGLRLERVKQMILYIFKWYSAWSKIIVSPFSWALKALIFKKSVITSGTWGNFETIEGWPRFLYTDNLGCFSKSSSTLVTTDVSLLESIFKIWSTTSPQFVWWKLTIYSSEFTTNTYNGSYFKKTFNKNCFYEVEMSCSYVSKKHFVLTTANDFKRSAKWIIWEEEITKSNLVSEVKAHKVCITSSHVNSMPAWL